jgi:hypothetical protein
MFIGLTFVKIVEALLILVEFIPKIIIEVLDKNLT